MICHKAQANSQTKLMIFTDDEKIEVIKYCQKSFLSFTKIQFFFLNTNNLFDVGLGSFCSAKTCKIVGIFLLWKMALRIQKRKFPILSSWKVDKFKKKTLMAVKHARKK